jgi:hypothetical protein
VATAEILRDTSTTVMENAAPILGDAIQGSTLEYEAAPNSLRSPAPIFFAPQQHDVLTTYWGVLIRGVVRSFFALVGGQSVAASASSAIAKNVFAWERLSLELMRFSSLRPNWDGEGAEEIPQMAIKNAADLLSLANSAASQVTSPQCPMPSIIPAVDGAVIFKWIREPRELKCTVRADIVEVVRWKSSDTYESDGYWEVPVQQVAEHFKWLLR